MNLWQLQQCLDVVSPELRTGMEITSIQVPGNVNFPWKSTFPCWFGYIFWLLTCWKLQEQPFFGLLLEITRILFKIFCYFDAMLPNKRHKAIKKKQTHSIIDCPPYLTVGTRYFSIYSSFASHQPHWQVLITINSTHLTKTHSCSKTFLW